MGDGYASRLATAWLASPDPEPWRRLTGSAVLVDLSGFTRLTESLANLGPEGAEVLHRSLTLCFTTLLEPSLALGGDIIGFAGDAALVWFDGDEHERRAADAALAMPVRLARLPAVITGGKRLRASVGVHTGTITAFLAGRHQRGVFLCGPVITTLVGLQSQAESGHVLASATLAERLPAGWLGARLDGGVELKRRGPALSARVTSATDPGRREPAADAVGAERVASVLSPAVRDVVAGAMTTGEHRAVSVGFISVADLDDLLEHHGPDAVHALLDDVANLVGEVADELSVAWLDTDVGAGSIKLLLTAGTPRATDDDEGRLLLAMRRIIDRAAVPLRGGAERGRVFSGALGVPGRQTFTVIGDAVNVAARALGRAADGELVIGEALHTSRRNRIHGHSLGVVTLRNRIRPVELWHVVAVDPPAPDARPGPVPSTPAVGWRRPGERERIALAWKRADEAIGTSLCLAGDPGMGASELIADALDYAGRGVAHVVSDRYSLPLPYSGVTSIVVAMAGASGVQPADAVEWLLAHSNLIDVSHPESLDEVHRALRAEAIAATADPQAVAHRVQATIGELIAVAAPRPWLLAVDDVDALDEASWLVVHDLHMRCQHEAWLVLTSTRGGDRTLAAHDHAETISLHPLDDVEARALVIEAAPHLRDDQVARIADAGLGNPFVLSELARHADPDSLPESLERLATACIDDLPPAVRQLVRDASTLGRRFDLSTVAEVLGDPRLADPGAWAGAMPLLWTPTATTMAFRHDAYWLAAHASLPFRRRRELHSAIADHLADRPGTGAAVLARHYDEAGRRREAFPLAVAAAASARSAGALVEASDLLLQAVRLAREVDRRAVGSLLVDHGEVLVLLGDIAGAERAFAAAARTVADPHDYALVCSHRADLAIRRGQYRQARTWAQKGMAMASSQSPAGGRLTVRLMLDDAAALHFLGRNPASLDLAAEALVAARAIGDSDLEGAAHLHLEMVHSVLNQPAARFHGESAIALFEAAGNDRKLGAALSNSGLTAMVQGRWPDAVALYRRASEVLGRIGANLLAATVDLNLGFLLVRRGELHEADLLALKSLRVFTASQSTTSAAYARHLRARIAAVEGRFDEAESMMHAARRDFAHLGERAMVFDCDVATLERLLAQGLASEAATLAAEMSRHLADGDSAAQVAYRLQLGITRARLGRLGDGVTSINEALAAAGDGNLPYEAYLCLNALIEIEAAGGPIAPPGSMHRRSTIADELGIVQPTAKSR